MVALMATPSRSRPFALAGRARPTASITAFPFSTSAFSSNENRPTGTATLPFLSSLNSTRPALTSRTALAVSSVTVPVFGLGISPRGPSTLPSLRTSDIASGVATATSKSDQPSWHFLTKSSKPTYSAPAALAASAAAPGDNPEGGLFVGRFQFLEFDLDDVLFFFFCPLAAFFFVRLLRSGGDARRFFQQDGSGR